MDEGKSITESESLSRRWVVVGVGSWLVVFVWSFISMWVTRPTGDGFTRGLNRIEGFLGWQGLALLLSLVVLILGFGRFRDAGGWRWLSRLPVLTELALVLFVVGTFVFISVNGRRDEALNTPPPKSVATAPAIGVSGSSQTTVTPEGVRPEVRPLETFRGVYRGGFESRDFHSLDHKGSGPWWLEAEGGSWDALQSHRVDRTGRGSTVCVVLTFEGRSEGGGAFGHLGSYDTRVVVESIEAIRAITEEEYEQVLETIR